MVPLDASAAPSPLRRRLHPPLASNFVLLRRCRNRPAKGRSLMSFSVLQNGAGLQAPCRGEQAVSGRRRQQRVQTPLRVPLAVLPAVAGLATVHCGPQIADMEVLQGLCGRPQHDCQQQKAHNALRHDRRMTRKADRSNDGRWAAPSLARPTARRPPGGRRLLTPWPPLP